MIRHPVPFPAFALAAAGFAALFAGGAAPARAIIVTGSQGQNTGAPTGALANSGWQYEGEWGGFLGTAVAPNYFVTAAHVGGSVGSEFYLDGIGYVTTGVTVISGTDLALWQVSGALPEYAPLYTGDNEVGQTMVDYGNGVSRGSVITLNGSTIGWEWGSSSGLESWGDNQFDGVVNAPGLGDLVTFSFNADADPNTGILAPGDSGGGAFIDDNGTWELAGVNYGIEEFYSGASTSDLIDGAIFDARGLYVQNGDGSFSYIDPAEYTDPVPQSAADSRISSSAAEIESITGLASAPEPSALVLFVPGIAAACGVGILRQGMRRRQARRVA